MNVLHVYGFGVHDMDSVCEGEKRGGERGRRELRREREREGGKERERREVET